MNRPRKQSWSVIALKAIMLQRRGRGGPSPPQFRFGKVNIPVNNAGGAPGRQGAAHGDEVIANALDLNVRSSLRGPVAELQAGDGCLTAAEKLMGNSSVR